MEPAEPFGGSFVRPPRQIAWPYPDRGEAPFLVGAQNLSPVVTFRRSKVDQS